MAYNSDCGIKNEVHLKVEGSHIDSKVITSLKQCKIRDVVTTDH